MKETREKEVAKTQEVVREKMNHKGKLGQGKELSEGGTEEGEGGTDGRNKAKQ